jgi:hypothetical protein
VLIGQPTLALVRDAAEVERVDPLELKGKAEPVPAFRLQRVREAPQRQHGAGSSGAEALARPQAWALEERRCGWSVMACGVGKSRRRRFLGAIDAMVVTS